MNCATKPDQSRVEVGPGGTAFVGPDAMKLLQAIQLKAALTLYVKTGLIPTRNVKAMDMLRIASEFTGKTYGRGQHEQAAEDVRVWVETMKAAMPVVDRKGAPGQDE